MSDARSSRKPPITPRSAWTIAGDRAANHSRDLGEPFDFLTWFEFAPDDEPAFDDLLARLRATREWHYVEREMDIRLVREEPGCTQHG